MQCRFLMAYTASAATMHPLGKTDWSAAILNLLRCRIGKRSIALARRVGDKLVTGNPGIFNHDAVEKAPGFRNPGGSETREAMI